MSLFVSSDMSVLAVHEDGPARSGALKSLTIPSPLSGADGHTRRNEQIDVEQPRTHLVSRQEYLATLLGKGHLYAMAVLLGCIGVIILAYALYTVVHDTFGSHGQINTLLFLLSESIFLGAIGAAAIWYARVTFAAAQKLAAVVPITPRTVADLSEFETLIRAYAFDPTQQNAELLRAVLDSQATPTNELLRATKHSLPQNSER